MKPQLCAPSSLFGTMDPFYVYLVYQKLELFSKHLIRFLLGTYRWLTACIVRCMDLQSDSFVCNRNQKKHGHADDLSVLRLNMSGCCLLSGLKQRKVLGEKKRTCGVLLHYWAPLVVCGCVLALPGSQLVICLLHRPLSQQPNVVWACCGM